jgi:hypothetical protein
MADVKISALPLASTPLAGTEVLPIVQSATTDQVSVANLTAGRAVSAASLTLTTTPLAVGSGGTGLGSLTAGYIPYGAGTSAFGNSSSLTYNGNTLSSYGVNYVVTDGIGNLSSFTTTTQAANIGATLALGGKALALNSWAFASISGRAVNATDYSGYLQFNVAGSGGAITEYMRITSAGLVGIGITNPAYTLDVTGSIHSTSLLRCDAGSGTVTPFVLTGGSGNLQMSFTSGSANPTIFSSSGEIALQPSGGNVGIGTSSPVCKLDVNGLIKGSSILINSSNIIAGANQLTIDYLAASSANRIISWGPNTSTAGNLDFAVASSNASIYNLAARIDASGNLLVGTTTNNSRAPRLALNGDSVTWSVGPSASNSVFVVYNASDVGVYMASGSTAWTGTSDERVKNITGNITDALAKTNTLRAVNFSWKADVKNTPHVGLIAQDVQRVLPEAVSENDGYLGVAYTDVIPLLTAAIQELAAKVQALEAKI